MPKPTKAVFRYTLHGCDRPIKAELIRCQRCYLTVHDVCYGVNGDTTSWLCDRCQTNSLAVSEKLSSLYILIFKHLCFMF